MTVCFVDSFIIFKDTIVYCLIMYKHDVIKCQFLFPHSVPIIIESKLGKILYNLYNKYMYLGMC